MPNPIVHFEITGDEPDKLRIYYKELFDWDADTDSSVAAEISDEGQYGFIDKVAADATGTGIPGGIGGGPAFRRQHIFYVGVDDVELALQKAESLGGERVLGPVYRPDGKLVVAHFTDPAGNLIGLAGPR